MTWAESTRRSKPQRSSNILDSAVPVREELLQEELFHNMLTLERRRAERSRDPFVLMLLDLGVAAGHEAAPRLISKVASTLLTSTRETDIVGWYSKGYVLGAIFTELNPEYLSTITETLRSKITQALRRELDPDVYENLGVSFHLFPQSYDHAKDNNTEADSQLYPDVKKGKAKRRIPMAAKRVIDVVGSAALLALISPVLAAVALAIKLTSKGPVIFRQERLGQFGKSFKCLKFRTMYANNDPKIHQEYVEKFIAGQVGAKDSKGEEQVFKIKDDPRVTPIGRFLRKTSLDEFPQFWNVLIGEMSLVGPRPPVPYEFKVYDVWHRRRVLEVKPGITGLWQVNGRSRTSFDDMVRLDLRYSQSWSIWLDLKILVATPRAVFGGEGAY